MKVKYISTSTFEAVHILPSLLASSIYEVVYDWMRNNQLNLLCSCEVL